MTEYEPGPGYSERPQATFATVRENADSTEFGFSDFFRLLAKARFWIAAGSTLCLFATAFVLFSNMLSNPQPVSYSTAVVVTMKVCLTPIPVVMSHT